jgi:hypothetical protein
MLAYCGRLFRTHCVLPVGPGRGLTALPVRRMRRTHSAASSGDRFPYIVLAMRGKRSPESVR